MATRFGLLIFDLDGTLVDSTLDLTTATNLTLEELGLEPRSTDEVRRFVGNGARTLLARAIGDRPVDLDRALARFLVHYRDHLVDRTRPYPGIPALLDAVAAIPMAIASNKPKRLIPPILCQFGWTDRFDPVLGGDSLPDKKPHPVVIESVCRYHGLSPERALMVGDSPQDIQAARAAGAAACAVAWGFRDSALLERAQPDWLIETPVELLNIV